MTVVTATASNAVSDTSATMPTVRARYGRANGLVFTLSMFKPQPWLRSSPGQRVLAPGVDIWRRRDPVEVAELQDAAHEIEQLGTVTHVTHRHVPVERIVDPAAQ